MHPARTDQEASDYDAVSPSPRGGTNRTGLIFMWTVFYRILALLAKYGKWVVDWAWRNRDLIFKWIGQGMAVEWIIQKIKEMLGIR